MSSLDSGRSRRPPCAPPGGTSPEHSGAPVPPPGALPSPLTVPVIYVERVSKRYGDLAALDAVSLEIPQGEFFGLLGPNGAGKTTLINILAGLVIATGGTARVMGFDVVADYRAARRALGVVPQELVFDPFFTVRRRSCFRRAISACATIAPGSTR